MHRHYPKVSFGGRFLRYSCDESLEPYVPLYNQLSLFRFGFKSMNLLWLLGCEVDALNRDSGQAPISKLDFSLAWLVSHRNQRTAPIFHVGGRWPKIQGVVIWQAEESSWSSCDVTRKSDLLPH